MRYWRLYVLWALMVCFVLTAATFILAQERRKNLFEIPKPKPYEITAVGDDWIQLVQKDYRAFWLRTKSISSVGYYEIGTLSDTEWDSVLIDIGPKTYRLDCHDIEQAQKIVNAILEIVDDQDD